MFKELLNCQDANEITLQKGMTDVGFEPTPPERLVPKTSALDHSANQSLLFLEVMRLLKLSMGD